MLKRKTEEFEDDKKKWKIYFDLEIDKMRERGDSTIFVNFIINKKEFPRLTETFSHREIHTLIRFGNLDVTVLSLTKASGTMSKQVAEVTHFRRINLITLFISIFTILIPNLNKLQEIHSLILENDKIPYF